MKIIFPSYTLNTELLKKANSSKYLFLLHGFTGSLKDWKEIAGNLNDNFNVVGVDLIGHGSSDSPNDHFLYTASSVSSQLYKAISLYTNENIWLLGYSMGGRAAISFAVNFPFLLEGLILESSSPGIKTNADRNERIKKDSELVKYISEHSIEEFTNYWMNLDIFNTQRRFSDEKRNQIRESKLLNDKTGLINSLKGFGTGIMPSYWNNLPDLNIKSLLITGKLDIKYCDINSEMVKLLPSVEHKIIQNSGHNIHLEEPTQFIKTANDFLSSF
ncbi:MAG: 2-succinyl-6-hydroxy-2,4-cyclohexadiene-1-carboxylate synthase [Ignavibacteriaceae bacterium]